MKKTELKSQCIQDILMDGLISGADAEMLKTKRTISLLGSDSVLVSKDNTWCVMNVSELYNRLQAGEDSIQLYYCMSSEVSPEPAKSFLIKKLISTENLKQNMYRIYSISSEIIVSDESLFITPEVDTDKDSVEDMIRGMAFQEMECVDIENYGGPFCDSNENQSSCMDMLTGMYIAAKTYAEDFRESQDKKSYEIVVRAESYIGEELELMVRRIIDGSTIDCCEMKVDHNDPSIVISIPKKSIKKLKDNANTLFAVGSNRMFDVIFGMALMSGRQSSGAAGAKMTCLKREWATKVAFALRLCGYCVCVYTADSLRYTVYFRKYDEVDDCGLNNNAGYKIGSKHVSRYLLDDEDVYSIEIGLLDTICVNGVTI